MPDTLSIHAVIFDLDDTLYPETEYVRSGYRAVGECVKEMFGRECVAAGAAERWLWSRFLGGAASGAFDAFSSEFQLGLSEGQILELVKRYRGHRPTIHPFGGAAEMLARLHGRVRLGLLSDGFLPAQKLKLDALKLARFLDAVVFTEELGRDCWKPSTAGFEEMQRRLGIDPVRYAYVADNPAKDFVGPNALGWRSIQFRRPGQIHADNAAAEGGEPQLVVRSPGELWEALLNV